MRPKQLILTVVGLSLLAWGPIFSQEIDKTTLDRILAEEQLKYIDSRLEFDFSLDGSDNDERTMYLQLSGECGIDMEVEKSRTGYWIKGAAEIGYDYSESKNDVKTESTKRTYRIRGFEEYYPLSVGYKRYLSEQSPFFLYSEGLGSWEKHDNATSSDNDPETSIGLGVGYGRVVDVGSYQRVLIVQEELMYAGLLTRRLPRYIVAQLIPLFRRAGDHAERIREVEKLLVNNGFIMADEITLDISYEIFDAIRSSFEKRKYGLEVKAAYAQEITKADPDLDKSGYLTAQLLWEYPVSLRNQVIALANLWERATGDDDYGSYTLELKLRSVHGRYMESETGIVGRYERWKSEYLDTSRKFGELFSQLSYEITDVIDWQTRVELTIDEYDDEKRLGYSATSQITYQLY